jgi:hypothetical protein
MAKKPIIRSVPNVQPPRKRACDVYPKPVYGEIQAKPEVVRAITAIVRDTTRPFQRRPAPGPSKTELWGWAAVIVMFLTVAAVTVARPTKPQPQETKTYLLQPNR